MMQAYAQGAPLYRARLRARPEDFQVNEQLGFSPSGVGEHWYVQIRKTGANTAWVAEGLAAFLGVKQFDVSYAGRKDRHAVTQQWFSCRVPGKVSPDWSALNLLGVEVLQAQRHDKKLHRGEHAGNEFVIRLTHLHSNAESHEANLTQRIDDIGRRGFPNYFGEQRFGHGGSNLSAADVLFAGGTVRAQQRDWCLSAVRSYMFNESLSTQVQGGDFQTLALSPHNAEIDADTATRTDLSALRTKGRSRDAAAPNVPRGWLYGISRKPTPALEAMAAKYPVWCAGLAKLDVKAQQRDLWVRPGAFSGRIDGADLLLSFSLPVGSYATSLIREIVDYGEE
ncbi:MAG: tRNA pseudouridine13 synthase [Candidatus Azotimanducaceae bacterium]|jgi:tRNA pseudouridine13 synthase